MAYQQMTKSQRGFPQSQGSQGNQRSAGTKPAVHPVLQLQRTLGNRGVQRLIETAGLPTQGESLISLEDGDDLSRADDVSVRLGQRQALGSSLPDHVRPFLESRLGIDLSPMRVQTGGEAHELAGTVNATAFTTGTDIFFREGAYGSDSKEGMRSLAPEATHVVQQSQGPIEGAAIEGSGVAVSDPNDGFERKAADLAEQRTTLPLDGALSLRAPLSEVATVQRRCSCGGSTTSHVGCQACRKNHQAVIQRQFSNDGKQDGAVETVSDAGNWFSETVGDAGEWVREAGSDAGSWSGETVGDVAGWVGEATSDAGEWIEGSGINGDSEQSNVGDLIEHPEVAQACLHNPKCASAVRECLIWGIPAGVAGAIGGAAGGGPFAPITALAGGIASFAAGCFSGALDTVKDDVLPIYGPPAQKGIGDAAKRAAGKVPRPPTEPFDPDFPLLP